MKVRDNSRISVNNRDFAHGDCNIKFKLKHQSYIVLHNLKKYDSHLIMQNLGKFSFQINVIPNGLEKHMSLNINNKLAFIDSL